MAATQTGLAVSDPANNTMTVDVMNEEQDTALSIALDEGYEEVVLRFITAGAELSSVPHSELVSLALSSRETLLLHALIASRIDLSGAVFLALSDIAYLPKVHLLSIVSKLIKAGAKLERSEKLDNVLHYQIAHRGDRHAIAVAARRGLLSVIELLLANGASAVDCNDQGRLP